MQAAEAGQVRRTILAVVGASERVARSFKDQCEASALGYVSLSRALAARIENYWLSEFPR